VESSGRRSWAWAIVSWLNMMLSGADMPIIADQLHRCPATNGLNTSNKPDRATTKVG
jgi:hypothetical protein